jgi:fatty acid desaturase
MNATTHPKEVALPKVRKRIFAHAEDLHCAMFQIVLVAAYGVAFFLYLYDGGRLAGITGPWSRAAFMVGAAMLLGWCSGINVGVNFHNHAHRPIFTSKWLNRWFGRFWTVSGGWPAFFWQHSHVTVHHADLLGEGDWTLPKRKKDGSFENPYWYSIATWPFRYAVHLWKDFRSGRGGPGVGRTALIELAIFFAIWSIPFLIDPLMGVGLWLLPQWFANAAVIGPGMYAQHAGCVRKSELKPYSHSNTYLSKFFNLTMFNIGYHVEHHDHPMVHWSKLPDLHERMKPELIKHGAHVLGCGYYRAGQLLCQAVFSKRAREKFERQHPAYQRAPDREPAEAPKETDATRAHSPSQVRS